MRKVDIVKGNHGDERAGFFRPESRVSCKLLSLQTETQHRQSRVRQLRNLQKFLKSDFRSANLQKTTKTLFAHFPRFYSLESVFDFNPNPNQSNRDTTAHESSFRFCVTFENVNQVQLFVERCKLQYNLAPGENQWFLACASTILTFASSTQAQHTKYVSAF